MNQTLLTVLVCLGVAIGIAIPSFLAIWLLKRLNNYAHNKWLRVEIKGYDQLDFPNECPNCLNTPSNSLVRIVREVHGHPISVTYLIDWPYCQTCTDFINEGEKLQKKYIRYWLVVFAVTMLGGLFYHARYFSQWGYLYAAIIFVSASIFLYLRYRNVDNKRSLKTGYIIKGHAVLLNHVGKEIFTGKKSLDIFLRHPQYAKLFLEKNAQLKPVYDPDKLKALIDRHELVQSSHNL